MTVTLFTFCFASRVMLAF